MEYKEFRNMIQIYGEYFMRKGELNRSDIKSIPILEKMELLTNTGDYNVIFKEIETKKLDRLFKDSKLNKLYLRTKISAMLMTDRVKEAEDLIEIQLKKHKKEELNHDILDLYNKKAMICGRIGRFKEALEIFEFVYKNRKLASVTGQQDILSHLGIAYCLNSKYNKAVSLFKKYIAFAKKNKLFQQLGAGYINLSNIYIYQNDYWQAVKYMKQARKYCKMTEQLHAIGVLTGNQALAYNNLGEPDKSIEIIKENIHIPEKQKDWRALGILFQRLGDAYVLKTKINQAIKCFQKSIKYLDSINEKFFYSDSILKKGLCEFSLADFKQARKSLNIGIKISRENKYQIPLYHKAFLLLCNKNKKFVKNEFEKLISENSCQNVNERADQLYFTLKFYLNFCDKYKLKINKSFLELENTVENKINFKEIKNRKKTFSYIFHNSSMAYLLK